MSWWLILELAVVLALGIFVYMLSHSSRTKGWFGEKMISFMLRQLDARQYRLLNNIYLPRPDGTTTQIDHLVVSQFGVFVIETKSYNGWIFGDAKSKVWTQCICSKGFRKPIKNTFMNPIHQNYAHLCVLENCTGIPKRVMRPVIAFSGWATFKSERLEGVCYFSEVVKHIRSFREPVIKQCQVDEIAEVILEWQSALTKKQVSSHTKNLRARHNGVSSSDPVPDCPYCGAPMVLRRRKSDGKGFYGCSRYPECKGIVNIRE